MFAFLGDSRDIDKDMAKKLEHAYQGIFYVFCEIIQYIYTPTALCRVCLYNE